VQAIIDATGMGEFEVCRTLFDLLNRNIISSVGRGEAFDTMPGRTEAPASPMPGYIVVAAAVLLALVAVVARWATPFAVVGRPPLLAGSYKLMLDAVSQTRLARLDRAVQAQRLASGELPRTLDDLVKAGLVDRSYLKDPWERPYHYAHTEVGYLLSAVDDRGRNDPASVIERSLPSGR
jgi:hypothetical protein